MRLSGTLLAVVAVLLASGCGDDSSSQTDAPNPVAAVEEAAKETLSAQTSAITVASTGADGTSYSYSGLIDVPAGSFDLRLDPDSGKPETFTRVPERLVAMKGEEAVNDVVRRNSQVGRTFSGSEGCWFSNPMPVHVNGGMSIEEGGTLAGTILESLPREIASAEVIGDGLYAVVLDESAARPADITKPESDRTWGHRDLLADLAAPIEVGVSDGRISSLRLTVDDYRVFYSPGLYSPERADRKPRDDVPLDVQLHETDRELHLEAPGCMIVT
jgi:hypothetical protein